MTVTSVSNQSNAFVSLPGLHIPRGCRLTVGGSSLQWDEGRTLCFDETYLHAAQHSGDHASSEARGVLIVDLWHPDLNAEQRSLIDYAFSTATAASAAAVGNSDLYL